MNSTVIQKKICLLGEFGVGKTSLISRFVYNRFSDSYLSTIGVKVSQKLLPPLEHPSGGMTQFNLLIWDIEGFDETVSTQDKYFIGAAGALVVADLIRIDTCRAMITIIENFSRVSPQAKIILVGNKCDLLDDASHSDTVAALRKIAHEQNSVLMLTSAKTGKNVEEAFTGLSV